MLRKVMRKVINKIVRHRQYNAFRQEFWHFKSLADPDRFAIDWEDCYPCLTDRTVTTQFDRHYVYHTAWAARVLAKTKPVHHVDIGSYLYFSTIISAYIPVQFYDYRPVQIDLQGLETGSADLNSLPFEDASVYSLSCMHVVEHVGLGRYGEPLDPNGDLKAMRELARVLAPGGDLLFVVPVGQPRVVFNAHRIYGYEQIIETFSDFRLSEFTLIQDREGETPILNASPEEVKLLQYGCGCFHFKRPEII